METVEKLCHNSNNASISIKLICIKLICIHIYIGSYTLSQQILQSAEIFISVAVQVLKKKNKYFPRACIFIQF